MELKLLSTEHICDKWYLHTYPCPCGNGTVEEHYLDFGIRCHEIWCLCPTCKHRYYTNRISPNKCELRARDSNIPVLLPHNDLTEDGIMPTEHVYTKEDLIDRFDAILGKTLGEIDDLGIFEQAQTFIHQKGIAGTIIEQCVLRYPPDTEQRPDLIVIDGDAQIPTELKTTGLRISDDGGKHYYAKEPMSITAVGVYDIAEQTFYDSHFWQKIQHLLLVYYHYLSYTPVKPAEYAPFPIKGYEFHEFSDDEIETLKHDWNLVRDFCESIISAHPGPRDNVWRNEVKQDYIEKHGALRNDLSFVELVPLFPPRFRLKQPFVNAMVADHFGFELEQLPGRYTAITDIDRKCLELTQKYSGRTIAELAELFDMPTVTNTGRENKSIAEQIIVRMFGGESKKMNQIKLFQQFGLIPKSIAMTPAGGRTEDMKLFWIDFKEITRETYYEEDGTCRPYGFEDSELYRYFSENELLCIIFMEPEKEYTIDPITHRKTEIYHPLAMNKFIGFKRLVFTDEFIDTCVRACWEDTRAKVLGHTLKDVIQHEPDGSIRYLKNGDISSAPNFMKSSQNPVFIRGSGIDSSLANKTECVNGIRMLPQFIWLKGQAVVNELRLT